MFALLSLSSWRLIIVVWLFLAVPWVCLQCLILVFPVHTHLLFLKARDFNATSLSTYDLSTFYTSLPHNLIKDELIDLIERTFHREDSPYLACSDRNAFFTSFSEQVATRQQ